MNEYRLSREVDDFERRAAMRDRQLAELKAKRDATRRFLVFGKVAQRDEKMILLHEAMGVAGRTHLVAECQITFSKPSQAHRAIQYVGGQA
jgi:hypothetical protein